MATRKPGVLAEGGEHAGRRGIICIPFVTPGLTVEPFWNTGVLAASESHSVVLKDAFVPEEPVFWNDLIDPRPT